MDASRCDADACRQGSELDDAIRASSQLRHSIFAAVEAFNKMNSQQSNEGNITTAARRRTLDGGRRELRTALLKSYDIIQAALKTASPSQQQLQQQQGKRKPQQHPSVAQSTTEPDIASDIHCVSPPADLVDVYSRRLAEKMCGLLKQQVTPVARGAVESDQQQTRL